MDPIARHLVPVQIDKELSAAYLDYSMSVIIGRALPDVRDGLKPVHRRILYAMWREGLKASHRYSKCAGVVGEVLKKYHPHGDMAVYDALVRMAQPWNMRYMLVDGQGNFGSVDGDNAAAYRYTECRMTKLAEQLLTDIDKETVNFVPNFDGATEEPEVLPAAFPHLLVNGSEGIAVGMATKIPPHNLKEVINGVLALMENPDIELRELMQHIPGPDFPTAGSIRGREGIFEAYSTGRGKLSVRGQVEFEEVDGRDALVVTELPFQVNKAKFQEDIVDLVRDKKLEGIHAVRDESNRQGMRVVIELKRDAVPEVVQNNLFKHTALQITFGVILLAIVNQRPQVLTLKQVLEFYLSHRREITLRRTRYDLRKALERAHILEGLRIALDHIDAVIATIRSSRTTEEAKERLMAQFGLSSVQSQAILDMRLQRLTGLERAKLEEEYKEVMALIDWLRAILASEEKLKEVIRTELTAVRDSFQDERRTRIMDDGSTLTIHDLVAEEDQVVTLSHKGYIKRTSLTEYRMQRRGGAGKTGMSTRDEDYVQDIFIANTHSALICFTDRGRCYRVSVLEVPEASPTARGRPLVNMIQLGPDEKVASVVSIKDFQSDNDLIFCTRKGLIKRTDLAAYANVRAGGLEACDILEGDSLLSVQLAPRDVELMLTSREGQCVRFAGEQVRPMGRIARGVRGIDVGEGDEVVSLSVLPADGEGVLLTATSGGYGKRTPLSEYPVHNRGGKGVIDIQTDERNGGVVGCTVVKERDQVMLITDTGRLIRMGIGDIRMVSRNTKGVRLMRLEEGERVVGMTRLPEADEEAGSTEGVESVEEDSVEPEANE
ncbi:MAG TPA: DNA gyrase subunit A [Myxococcota bacterium]|nr:DNA gyrase subunit A [Myxococcota bacterium]